MSDSRRCIELLAAWLLLAGAAQAQSFEDVRAAVAAGSYADARRIALALADRAESARAVVWVDYGARDYLGAARAAREGLAAHPDDDWLAERAAAAALAQRDGRAAERACDDLARLANALPAADERRDGLARTAAEYRALASELVALDEAARRAATRARYTVLALLASAVGLVLWSLREPRQRMSSRPEPSRP